MSKVNLRAAETGALDGQFVRAASIEPARDVGEEPRGRVIGEREHPKLPGARYLS